MILSDKREYVYIGIPRTATRSTTQWLVQNFDGFSPNVSARFGFQHNHRIDIPDPYRKYRSFVVVRHPVDRFVSFSRIAEYDEPDEKRNLRFRSWLIELRDGRSRHNEGAWHGSQSRWIEMADPDAVLRYEDLPGCLDNLWFVGSDEKGLLAHVGEPKSNGFKVSQENIDFIRKDFANDFQGLGYDS